MRPSRQRPPSPQLDLGDDQDARWFRRACRDNPSLWDDAAREGERGPAREKRHEIAKAACETCPALALCRALPTEGLHGIVAGRYVGGGK